MPKGFIAQMAYESSDLRHLDGHKNGKGIFLVA